MSDDNEDGLGPSWRSSSCYTQDLDNCTNSDSGSDLDMDIDELAKRPVQGSSSNQQFPITVDVVEDESESDQDRQRSDEESTTSHQNQGRYGFRKRKSQVSYKDMAMHSDDEDAMKDKLRPKKCKPKDILDIPTLLWRGDHRAQKQLDKFLRNPECVEELRKWRININDVQKWDFDEDSQLAKVEKFFEKCSRFVDHLIIVADERPGALWRKVLKILLMIFKHARFLKKLHMRYNKDGNKEQITQILQAIKDSGQTSISSLKFLSSDGSGIITEEDLDAINSLSEAGVQWCNIELGDGLLITNQSKTAQSLERLFELGKDSLEKLIIHGGFKANSDWTGDSFKLKLIFPKKMGVLKELKICPNYEFMANPGENMNPASKRWREIRLDFGDGEEGKAEAFPVKTVLVLDHAEFPKLEKVVLGNLVEVEECGLAFLRNLKSFRCGSRWDLAVRFPKTEGKKGPSLIQELQLPDGLKDPSFVQNLGKFFPSVKKVWIFLPSVAVLRTFFKCYENSVDLEELYLKTQFDFETTMESCLLPELRRENDALSPKSRSVIQTLKEYTHCLDYVRYHNIELPIEDLEDLAEIQRNGAGIRALKSLKVLDLEHIPRNLFLPNPEDERRWYDHNFKYLSTTFGFNQYPFSRLCHKEIIGMDLREYHWKNLSLSGKASEQFDAAGYVTVEPTVIPSDNDGDNLFIPVSRSRNPSTPTNNVKVTIKPSMLLPSHYKNKQETN